MPLNKLIKCLDETRQAIIKLRVVHRRLDALLPNFPIEDGWILVVTAIEWAKRMLALGKLRRKYGKNEAAAKIQRLFRARNTTTEGLMSLLYEKGVDPDTGATYYYNVKTGEASWDAPSEI